MGFDGFLEPGRKETLSMRIFSCAGTVALAAATIAIAAVDTASAVPVTTVGLAVGSVGSMDEIGIKASKPDLGGDAIKYFIPLGNSGGTYGVGRYKCGGTGFGTCSDTGDGGKTLKMILYFSSVSTLNPSKLTINFEDLDLHGVSDPAHFFESLNIFRAGTSLTGGWITDIGGLITGDNDDQTLNLDLGKSTVSSLWLVLKFKATSDFIGTNTAEFLRATISELPQEASPVPLPGALVLMGSVLTGFWGIGFRRRRARSA
jgi:hypothetical protein